MRIFCLLLCPKFRINKITAFIKLMHAHMADFKAGQLLSWYWQKLIPLLLMKARTLSNCILTICRLLPNCPGWLFQDKTDVSIKHIFGLILRFHTLMADNINSPQCRNLTVYDITVVTSTQLPQTLVRQSVLTKSLLWVPWPKPTLRG